MPTIQAQPGDILWLPMLATGTFYDDYPTAYAAAVVLSAANSNAAVQIIRVDTDVISPGNVQLPGNGTAFYAIQLATAGGTYYPKATAIVQAYALSASNSNASVLLGRVIQLVTAP